MLILEAGNIKKYFSDRLIVELDGLKIYSGDKIGVVGQNGAGKTTLMNILSKEIQPDEGFVKLYCEAAYIRQFSQEKIDSDKKLQKEFELSRILNQDVFSGGESTRIRISNALNRNSLMLFADEPTANLDYKGIELLREKLQKTETFLLISHDRGLLDDLCNKILEIRDGKVRLYSGNYSLYREQTDNEFRHAGQEYEKYVAERTKLEEAVRERQSKAKSIRKAPARMGNSEARLHRRSSTEKQEKINNAVNSLKTRLDKLEVKEKPKELPSIKLDFSLTNPPENKIVISAKSLSFSYGSKDIFRNTGFKIYNGSKTAIWGENGTGKTTLLNLIASRDDSIYIVPKAVTGHFHQSFENLNLNRTVLENVMEDSVQTQSAARTILARLLISGDDVYKKAGVLSGGERIKVSFAKLFVSNANVLILDEPTNYLDMTSIEALENVLRDYEGTVLFVSHDKAFVNGVADRLLAIEDKELREFEGSLKDYISGRQNAQEAVLNDTERTLLQMRITETIAKMSKSNADKEALEAEYQALVKQLK
ncbi:MAG: ABC-F type ribosomal protection protein [Clostridiaceae bacterium]|nr:ABC-F type ribosomal protection protein [Clostridiaceae bacterium]